MSSTLPAHPGSPHRFAAECMFDGPIPAEIWRAAEAADAELHAQWEAGITPAQRTADDKARQQVAAECWQAEVARLAGDLAAVQALPVEGAFVRWRGRPQFRAQVIAEISRELDAATRNAEAAWSALAVTLAEAA